MQIGLFVKRPIDVMADIQVGEAVAVKSAQPALVLHAGYRLKWAFAVTSSKSAVVHYGQSHVAVAGDEQIGPAVAVVIGDGDTVAVESGLSSPTSAVTSRNSSCPHFVKTKGWPLTVLSRVEIAAAGEKQIEQPSPS